MIPNIITPNRDDKNEYFVIDQKLDHPALKIINRWGKEVFYSTNYQDSWNGDDLPDGVYFYTIQSQCLSETLNGPLTIKR